MALQAQGLQYLLLALHGLVHGDHVVELTQAQLDGGGAKLAQVALLLQNVVPAPAGVQAPRFEEVLKNLGGGARQALAPYSSPSFCIQA